MGIDTNFHVGAYLEVKMKGEEEEVIKKKICSDCHKNFSVYHNDKFCSYCGKQLEIESKREFRYSSFYDLVEGTEFEDELIQTDEITSDGTNDTLILTDGFDSFREGDETLEITEDFLTKKVNDFLIENSKIIEFLRDHKLVISAIVNFGAFVWYN